MNNFACPFCDTSIETDGEKYVTECDHFPLSEDKSERIPYIVSNLKGLNNKSIVWDVGGYTGIFAKCMVYSFTPELHIFEPTESYYKILQGSFPDATVYKFGLGNSTRDQLIFIDGYNTSLHKHLTKNSITESVTIVNVNDMVEQFNKQIDLMAINCEGGEYEILPALIQSSNIKKVKQLLVQFHKVDENSLQQANKICEQLKSTHSEILNVGIWKWVLFKINE